jgi:VWFA-related protein
MFLCPLVAAATVGSSGPVGAQRATFSSRVEAVRVDVLVTDAGKPVLGLEAKDFQVYDDGVAQQVDLVSFEQVPLNVVLALDMSASVAGERLARLRSAAGAAIGALRGDDEAALVTFSHLVRRGAELTKNVESVRAAMDYADGTGGTALVDGAYAGLTIGESDAGRALLVVFSDGLDTSSWLTADAVLEVAKQSDVVAYAVSVRSPLKPDFLRDLTSLTGGRIFEVEKTANLEPVFIGILEEFRHRYLVSYTPRGVPRGGWHRLDVRVKRQATVKARPGYLAGS